MAAEIKRLLKFSVGSWIVFFFSFIASPITTFLLAPQEFGKFAAFILFQTLTVYVITLGMDQVFMRYYHSTDNKVRLLLQCLFIELGSFVLTLTMLLLFNNKLNYFITGDDAADYFLAAGGAFLCLMLSLSNLGLGFLRMENRPGRFSLIQVSNSLVNYAVFFLILIYFDRTYKSFIYASVISASFQFVFIYFFSVRIATSAVNTFLRTPWNLKENLKYGLPFVPSFFIEYVFSNSDRYFLRFFGDFQSLGIYSLGLRLSAAFSVVQSGFHMYWTPFSYERYLANPDDRKFYPKIFDLLNWGLLLLILAASSFREIITYIIAPEFFSVINFFPFLLFAPYFYSLTEITQVGINFSQKTKLFFWINGLTLVVNIPMGYFLIDSFGPQGAALNVAVTSFILFALKSYYGYRNYDIYVNWKKFVISFSLVFIFVTIDLLVSMEFYLRMISFAGCLIFISSLYLESVRFMWSLTEGLVRINKLRNS